MSGLVDYDISDSDEDQQEEGEAQQKSNGIQNEQVPDTSSQPSSSTISPPLSSSTNVLKNLPKIQQSQAKPKSGLFLKDVIKRSSDGRIQIKALDISDDDDSDIEEEQESARKRIKPSDKGCGLFSMLPEPKQKVIKTNNSNSDNKLPVPSGLIPKSVTDRQKAPISHSKLINMDISKNKHNNFDDDFDDDDDDDDDDTESFFFSKHRPIIPESAPSTSSFMPSTSIDAVQPEFGPSRPQNVNEEYEHQAQASSSNNVNEDFAYKRMIANKFGDDEPSNVNIIDFDMGQHLRENKEWIKNISKESETIEDTQINGPAPTSAAKRRNQITYLAYQAKKREVELKNQWAANRQTMQQARSRYGF